MEETETETKESAAAPGRLEALEKELSEQKNRYLYLYAELENYKKRAHREREDLLKYGWESAARELLGVIDNLERAIAHMPKDTSKSLLGGLDLVLRQFRALLDRQGIRRLEVQNQAFDPALHEAVESVDSDLEPGTIVTEHLPGYRLHDRLLRPARVAVSKGAKVHHG